MLPCEQARSPLFVDRYNPRQQSDASAYSAAIRPRRNGRPKSSVLTSPLASGLDSPHPLLGKAIPCLPWEAKPLAVVQTEKKSLRQRNRRGRRSSWTSTTRASTNVARTVPTEDDDRLDHRSRKRRRAKRCHVSRLSHCSSWKSTSHGNKTTPLPVLLLFGLDVMGARSRPASTVPWDHLWPAFIRPERRRPPCPHLEATPSPVTQTD